MLIELLCFRFNHPAANCKDSSKEFACVDKGPVKKPSKRELRKKWDGLTLRDFEFAKRELTQQQNAKLVLIFINSYFYATEVYQLAIDSAN